MTLTCHCRQRQWQGLAGRSGMQHNHPKMQGEIGLRSAEEANAGAPDSEAAPEQQ